MAVSFLSQTFSSLGLFQGLLLSMSHCYIFFSPLASSKYFSSFFIIFLNFNSVSSCELSIIIILLYMLYKIIDVFKQFFNYIVLIKYQELCGSAFNVHCFLNIKLKVKFDFVKITIILALYLYLSSINGIRYYVLHTYIKECEKVNSQMDLDP